MSKHQFAKIRNNAIAGLVALLTIASLIFASIPANLVVVDSSSTVYSPIWGGYSVYYGSPPSNRLAYVSANIRIVDIGAPNYWDGESPVALAPWIGMSLYSNGAPLLLQAGYHAEYFPNNGSKLYLVWVELYPYPPHYLVALNPTRISELSHIRVSLLKYPGQTTGYIDIAIYLTDGTEIYREIIGVTNIQSDFAYAHFIVETPEINNTVAILPRFDNNISIYDNIMGYAYTSDPEITTYSVGSIIANGNYINEILAQCIINPDIIINNMYISYDIDSNSANFAYATSYRC